MDDVIPRNEMARDASERLNAALSTIDFGSAMVYIICGYPRSDIGKAELVSRLGLVVGSNFSIIKVDGFLNTNISGRHPSRTRNDFVVYRRHHEHIEFGGNHLILCAPLLQEFFDLYGECYEHLAYTPHVAKYFARCVFERWQKLGSPRTLFVEIGGTISDTEVASFVIPGLRLLREQCHTTKVILLSEVGYNGEGIKAKPLMQALSVARGLGLDIDLAIARMPLDAGEPIDILELNAYIEGKLEDAMIICSGRTKVICLPFFRDARLTGYTEFLRKHLPWNL